MNNIFGIRNLDSQSTLDLSLKVTRQPQNGREAERMQPEKGLFGEGKTKMKYPRRATKNK